MSSATLLRRALGLLLLGSLSFAACKRDDVRPRAGHGCHSAPTPAPADTTKTGAS